MATKKSIQAKPTILVINGPNLNLLGKREPDKYGTQTLNDIAQACVKKFSHLANIEFYQSNHEGDIVEKIQNAKVQGLILNLGAYTHTSIAIMDSLVFAIQNNGIKASVEVHISNIHSREGFRHHSFISSVVNGSIVGLGSVGYEYAIDYCLLHIKAPK